MMPFTINKFITNAIRLPTQMAGFLFNNPYISHNKLARPKIDHVVSD